MYNSKPRYNRFTSEISVPENYSGSAFRDIGEEVAQESEIDENNVIEDPKSSQAENIEESKECSKVIENIEHKKGFFSSGLGFDFGKLFRGGFGFEELLIIGLILLLGQSDESNDIILFLVLLLFIQ